MVKNEGHTICSYIFLQIESNLQYLCNHKNMIHEDILELSFHYPQFALSIIAFVTCH